MDNKIEKELISHIIKYNDLSPSCLYPNAVSFIIGKKIKLKEVKKKLSRFIVRCDLSYDFLDYFKEDIKENEQTSFMLAQTISLKHAFIEKQAAYLDWRTLSGRSDITISFLVKYQGYIDSMSIRQNKHLTYCVKKHVEKVWGI